MIAMLGMYDMPAIRPANDRFWTLIRARLGMGPDRLSRDIDPWQVWQAPDLVLAQTCGLPYRSRLHRQVRLVGTPDYALPGCPPGYYRSVLVVRADARGTTLRDFTGGVFAFNEPLSQSGWAAPMVHFAELGLCFKGRLQTGSHAQSARAVAAGRADLAALDAQTWRLLQQHDPIARQLRPVGQTRPTPGLPYITAGDRDPAPIAAAIRGAIADLAPRDRAMLRLNGLIEIDAAAYLAIPNPPAA